MATDTIGTAKQKAENVLDRSKDALHDMKDKLGEYYEEGKQRAIHAERSVESLIRDKPMQSVLIVAGVAAGLGLIAGCLMRR